MKVELNYKIYTFGIRSIFYCLLIILGSCNNNHLDEDAQRNISDSIYKCVFKKSDSLFQSSKIDLAINYLDSEQNNRFIDDKNYLAAKYIYLTRLSFNYVLDPVKTSLYLDSLKPMASIIENLGLEHKITYNVIRGKVAAKKKDYELAYSSYFKIKQMLDSIYDPCSYATYYNNLGDLLWLQNRFSDAVFYWRKGVDGILLCPNADTLNAFEQLQVHYDNIGIGLERINDLDSAVVYYNKALKVNDLTISKYGEKRSYLVNRGVVLGNLGGVLLKQKKYEEAEPILIKSISINDQAGFEKADALLTKIKLADLYLQINELTKCAVLIKQVDNDLLAYGGLIPRQRIAKLKENYYTKTEEYKLANQYLRLYNLYTDSINYDPSLATKSGPIRIVEYEQMERANQLELLKQQGKTRQLILYVVIGFLIMLAIIVFIVKRNETITSKQNIELVRLNRENQNSNYRLSESLLSLQQSYDENNQILKTVAHDLRSPIAGIMSLVRLMKYDENLTKEELTEFIILVEKSGKNALEFIEDLLVVNKTEQIKKSAVDILPILESCVQIATDAAKNKNQKIILNASSQLLQINEPKIWRVINNLLSNAVKFSKANAVITVSTETTNDSYIISVIDNGIGIPDELKPSMFSAYTGVGREGTTGETSFGLGLSISRQIVVAHGGKIWFSSETDKGTTFFVELPLV